MTCAYHVVNHRVLSGPLWPLSLALWAGQKRDCLASISSLTPSAHDLRVENSSVLQEEPCYSPALAKERSRPDLGLWHPILPSLKYLKARSKHPLVPCLRELPVSCLGTSLPPVFFWLRMRLERTSSLPGRLGVTAQAWLRARQVPQQVLGFSGTSTLSL